jgi:hypothetical protein
MIRKFHRPQIVTLESDEFELEIFAYDLLVTFYLKVKGATAQLGIYRVFIPEQAERLHWFAAFLTKGEVVTDAFGAKVTLGERELFLDFESNEGRVFDFARFGFSRDEIAAGICRALKIKKET